MVESTGAFRMIHISNCMFKVYLTIFINKDIEKLQNFGIEIYTYEMINLSYLFSQHKFGENKDKITKTNKTNKKHDLPMVYQRNVNFDY